MGDEERRRLAEGRLTAMIRGCQDIVGSADSGMCIASPGFGPAPRSPGSSVIRGRGSSPSPGAQKNTLRNLRAPAPQLVRSEDAPRAGSLVRRSPHLPGRRTPARGLPALRDGEAGAARLPGRLAVLHQTLCLLRRPALPGLYDSGCRARDAPELENHQGARDAVHARAAAALGRGGARSGLAARIARKRASTCSSRGSGRGRVRAFSWP